MAANGIFPVTGQNFTITSQNNGGTAVFGNTSLTKTRSGRGRSSSCPI